MAYITGDDLLDQIPGLLAAGVDLAHLDTGLRTSGPVAAAWLAVAQAFAGPPGPGRPPLGDRPVRGDAGA